MELYFVMLAVFPTASAASNDRYALHDVATLSTSLGLENIQQSGHTVTIDKNCVHKRWMFRGKKGSGKA